MTTENLADKIRTFIDERIRENYRKEIDNKREEENYQNNNSENETSKEDLLSKSYDEVFNSENNLEQEEIPPQRIDKKKVAQAVAAGAAAIAAGIEATKRIRNFKEHHEASTIITYDKDSSFNPFIPFDDDKNSIIFSDIIYSKQRENRTLNKFLEETKKENSKRYSLYIKGESEFEVEGVTYKPTIEIITDRINKVDEESTTYHPIRKALMIGNEQNTLRLFYSTTENKYTILHGPRYTSIIQKAVNNYLKENRASKWTYNYNYKGVSLETILRIEIKND